MISLLFALVGIALVLFTLPLTLELALLTTAAAFLQKQCALAEPNGSSTDHPFRLAVIVPAHNEEHLIEATVASLLLSSAQTGTNAIRLLVFAHNCTDATAERAQQAGAEVRTLDQPGGKGTVLAFAFASVAVDGYLVIDADSTVDAPLLSRVYDVLSNSADALQCRYEALPATSRKARLGAIAFRAINVIRPRGRERLGLSCGILGNGFAVRRSVLDRVPYDAHSVVEDLEFHLALVRRGIRVRYLDDVAVRSFIATTRSQHARWEGGRTRMAAYWLPRLLASLLKGRLTLFEPMLDVAGLPIAQQVVLLLIGLTIPLWWLRRYCAFALLVLVLHVTASILAGDDPVGEAFSLLFAPFYIVWKLISLPMILRASRKKAAWVRTDRSAPATPSKPTGGME